MRAARRDPPRAGDERAAPFRVQFASAEANLYARQRRLFDRPLGGNVDRLEVEETAMAVLTDAVACGYRGPVVRSGGRARRMFEAAQHVRHVLAAHPSRPCDLRSLSAAVGLSPYQLCRAFSRVSGETLPAYRCRLRLLSSQDRVASGQDLTAVALDLGFSSHSHFTATCRQTFGDTPSAYRRAARSRSLNR
jgi:AraC family transcriptional regulator